MQGFFAGGGYTWSKACVREKVYFSAGGAYARGEGVQVEKYGISTLFCNNHYH